VHSEKSRKLTQTDDPGGIGTVARDDFRGGNLPNTRSKSLQQLVVCASLSGPRAAGPMNALMEMATPVTV
jgi:hypothetical protein